MRVLFGVPPIRFLLPAAALLAIAMGATATVPAFVRPTPWGPPPSTTTEARGGGFLTPALSLPDVAHPGGDLVWSPLAVPAAAASAAGLMDLLRLTALLLTLVAGVASLGLLGLQREQELASRMALSLKRALGATRRRLFREALLESVVVLVLAASAATMASLFAGRTIRWSWSVTTETAGEGAAFLTGVGWIALAVLLVGAGYAASATMLRTIGLGWGVGASRAAPLTGAEPVEGSGQWIAVLQIAATTGVLLGGLALLPAAEPPSAVGAADAAYLLEIERSGPGGVSAAALLAALEGQVRMPGAPQTAGGGPRSFVALTSPGTLVGLGMQDLVYSECGRCSMGGMFTPVKTARSIHHVVSADSFAAMGMDVREGRTFSPLDLPGGEAVAVVSRSFAREQFERGQAVGRRIQVGGSGGTYHRVVGVVDDHARPAIGAHDHGFGEVYLPVSQTDLSRAEVIVAGIGGVDRLVPVLAEAGWRPTGVGRTVAESVAAAIAPRPWFGRIWILLGLGALTAAGYGVFSTMARRVETEAREIRIHRAVGATRVRIAARYLGAGLRVGGIGSLLGLWAGLFLLARLEPPAGGAAGWGPALVAVPVLTMLACAVSGSLLPALRAAGRPLRDAA